MLGRRRAACLCLTLCGLLAQAVAPAAAAVSLGEELRGAQQQAVSGSIAAPDVAALRAAEAALVDHGKYTQQGVQFDCSGLVCAGTLYVPKAAAGGASKAPVVVMAHGLGGQRVWLDKYASVFAASGFAVLTFDYQ
jgi:predicted dienelactone hydrolase